jgi:hypothetical protein
MLLFLIKKIIKEIRIKRDPIAYARSIGVRIGEDCKLVSLGDHVDLSLSFRL